MACFDRGMITFRARCDGPTCLECRHFVDDPHTLERWLPGVLVLSSTYGSTWGDSGVCTVFATLQDPEAGCDRFEGRSDRFDAVPGPVTSG
jgi:hypothetical protein